MKIKTFYAKSMTEALRCVKGEFGPEALILSTREKPLRSAFGLRARTAVEVVAAADTEDSSGWARPESEGNRTDHFRPLRASWAGAVEARRAPPAFIYAAPPMASTAVSGRDGALKDSEHNEMRNLLCSLARISPLPSELFSDAAAFNLYHDLISNELSDWLAYKLLDDAQKCVLPHAHSGRDALRKSVAKVAKGLLPPARDGAALPGKRIVAFVGPTGVGKTSTAAKLGARLSHERNQSVVLLTTDTSRIGGVDQLRAYAGLMGLPFRAVARVCDLPRMLAENSQRDFILIDTAGRAQRDLGAIEELMAFLLQAADIERHLVISATTKPSDMHEIVDRFSVCRPDHLLFTKLDETTTFGPIFGELVRTQKPLSYLADGQRVPEDLHTVNQDEIVDLLLSA